MHSSRQAEGREWSGGDGSGVEWRGREGEGRAGQGRVPDCLGGLSRVGISSRSTRPWNGQPPNRPLRARIQSVRIHVCNTSHLRIDEVGAAIECLTYWGKLIRAS